MSLRAAFWLICLVGLALRLAGLRYGLPAVFNSDEPHLVNLAVSFGRGTLRPDLFKYPTLYPYALFAAFGVMFLFWSGFGLRKSISDFGGWFAWHPGPFYVVARSLSAAASLAAILPVHRAAATFLGPWGALVAAGTLAVSPVVVEAAHAAKPEALMFGFAAAAWLYAGAYIALGSRRELLLAGLCCGLAGATQYSAAPLAVMLAAAWLARRVKEGAPFSDLPLAVLAALAGVFAGAPYLFLDYPKFAAHLADIRKLESMGTGIGLGPVAANLACFSGPWVAGAAAALGAFAMLRRDKARALWLLLPAVFCWLALSRSSEGGWARYGLAVYPGLALLAGAGFESLALGGPAAALALAAILAPGIWKSASYDRMVLQPDTRTLSAKWLEGNVPPGKTVLLDQESASPNLPMSRETVADLLARTKEVGHPRARFYQYMLNAHPGGGWRVYRVVRDYLDLHSYPEHVKFSQAAQPILDVRAGLAAARKAGVEIVVLTSFGAQEGRSPELSKFLQETRGEGKELARFEPEDGRVTGPSIQIYSLR